MPSTRPARAYRSTVRRKRAEQTRARIIAASKWLFSHRGYAETTIEAIAARAGVSAQTVYAAFGSKAAVLAALVESLVASVRQDEAAFAVTTAEDHLRRCARIARRIYDSLRAVLSIADNFTGDLGEIAQAREKVRFASLTKTIETLSAAGRLSRYPDAAVAHDLLWTLTGPDTYRRLVIERSWDPDRYEAELAEILIRALLA